jgi:RNA polymerase sigma-70 factor (ECF subfamily)
MDPDVQLLSGVAGGNEADFEELYRRYQPRLAAFFRQRIRDPHATQELIQETMLVVWDRAQTFNATSKASTWILGIGYRKLLEWNRKDKRAKNLFRTEADTEPEKLAGSPQDDASRKVGKEQLMEQVKDAIKDLTDEHRTVIELTFQQGLSYNEIADIMDTKPGTIKSRMFYAKQKLKELLTERGMKGDELWQISKGA